MQILILSATPQRELSFLQRIQFEYPADAQPILIFCHNIATACHQLVQNPLIDMVIADDLTSDDPQALYHFMRHGAGAEHMPRLKKVKFIYATVELNLWYNFDTMMRRQDPHAAIIGNRDDAPLAFNPDIRYQDFRAQRTLYPLH